MSGSKGSLIVSKETRRVLGNDIINFAEQNIVNQPALPVVSPPDCGPDRKPTSSFRQQFMNSAADINQICRSFKEIQQNDGTSYDHKWGRDNGTIFYTDVLRKGTDFISSSPVVEHLFKTPGTGKDWNAFVLFHELEHSRDDTDGKPSSEYSADMAARRHYQEALKQGLVKDAGVPDALRGIRAMTEMRNGFGSADFDVHGVAALAGLPGININGNDDEHQAASDMNNAKHRIYREIGLPLVSEKLKENFRADGTRLALNEEELNLDAEHKAMLERYYQTDYQGDEETRLTDLKEILKGAHLSEECQKRADGGMEVYLGTEAVKEAKKAVKEDPSILYETARRMYLQGAFNDEATGKTFVGEFVRSAETYGQGFFKTDNKYTAIQPAVPAQNSEASIPASAPSWNQKQQMAPGS